MSDCNPSTSYTVSSSSSSSGSVTNASPSCPIIALTREFTVTAAGRYYIGYFNDDTVIRKLNVLLHKANPLEAADATFEVKYGYDYSGLGADLTAAPIVANSISTGTEITTFDPAIDVKGGMHMWAVFTGTINADRIILNFVYMPACETIDGDGNHGVPVTLQDGTEVVMPLEDLP